MDINNDYFEKTNEIISKKNTDVPVKEIVNEYKNYIEKYHGKYDLSHFKNDDKEELLVKKINELNKLMLNDNKYGDFLNSKKLLFQFINNFNCFVMLLQVNKEIYNNEKFFETYMKYFVEVYSTLIGFLPKNRQNHHYLLLETWGTTRSVFPVLKCIWAVLFEIIEEKKISEDNNG